MAKDLDSMVEDFRTRPLDFGLNYYLSCDALTMKLREGGRVVKTSVLLATGVDTVRSIWTWWLITFLPNPTGLDIRCPPKGVRSELIRDVYEIEATVTEHPKRDGLLIIFD